MTNNFVLFFNSNFFVALTTLIVGGVAIYLYLRQRKDNKRDSARLIIQEIRYAEQLIKNARDVGYVYALANKILPTNSWHKNIHHFIKNLGETDTDTISKFYSNVAYLDEAINYISEFVNKTIMLPPMPEETDPEKVKEDVKKMNFQRAVSQKMSQDFLKDISEKIDFRLMPNETSLAETNVSF